MQQYEYLVIYLEMMYRHIQNSWFSVKTTIVYKSNGIGHVN